MKKILFGLVLCLMACEAPSESITRFTYAKDPRTGLCFALYNMNYNNGSMSYVPCTEEVEKAIKIDQEKFSK